MKRLVYLLFFVIALTGLVILPSCKKFITVAPITIFSTPLQALIDSDSSLSVFYAVVKKAKDSALYGGIDSVTVLIPTNTAFASQGITVSTVNSMSAAAADSLLRYYYIPSYDSLTPGSFAFTNKLGTVIYGYTDSTGNNYFNGIPATRQSLLGSNATVFELGTPLIPAITVESLIASDTTLSYFAEAVKHTNLNLAPASGWNTILAPVDTAFIAAGYPTLGSIDSADIGTLTNILQYHILPGEYFTSSFTGLSTVTSLQGSNINITFNNGLVQFTGTSNITAAGISISNRIAAGNIILQNITGVLMP
jgi:uncharacterized surface protein with fasciclin (FAS1) repeats